MRRWHRKLTVLYELQVPADGNANGTRRDPPRSPVFVIVEGYALIHGALLSPIVSRMDLSIMGPVHVRTHPSRVSTDNKTGQGF